MTITNEAHLWLERSKKCAITKNNAHFSPLMLTTAIQQVYVYVCIYIYVYVYVYICMYMYMYIYIYTLALKRKLPLAQ